MGITGPAFQQVHACKFMQALIFLKKIRQGQVQQRLPQDHGLVPIPISDKTDDRLIENHEKKQSRVRFKRSIRT